MRALKFITGNLIYNPAHTYKFQLKTTIDRHCSIWVNFRPIRNLSKGRLYYHLCVKCFSQLSFDSEVYTKSATADDFVYISETNESCEKHSTKR